MGVVYTELITTSAFGICLSLYTFRNVGFRFKKEYAKQLISFGAPFILTNIGAFILTFSDRYFLKVYSSLDTVGIYSLGYKIGFLLSFVVTRPLQNIWAAQRFEVVKQKDYTFTFNRTLLVYCLGLVSVGLFLSLFSRDLFRIMSAPAFVDAYRIVPIVVLAYTVQGLTSYFDFGIFYIGKSIEITKGTCISAISIIALSFWLIPEFGGMGAASTTLIAFLIRLFYFYYSSQKLFKIEYQLGKVYACISISVTIYLLYLFSLSRIRILDNIIFSICFSSFLICVYFVLLLSFRIIPYEFVIKAKGLLIKKLSFQNN